ncbi:MAG TPA: hypothetical protein VLB44_14285, partial [Kofleriaceae bacterium]|nr:hypothetical protein [Kofleriaceae bacterium]
CKKKEENKAAGTTGSGAAPAAGAPATPAAPAGAMNMSVDQACDKVVAMMGDMGKAVEGAGEDCNKMGDSLQKWADDNKAFMAWAKEQDKDEKKKKEFEDKCKPKLEGAMEKMGPLLAGAMKCGENPKVKAAMESMDK